MAPPLWLSSTQQIPQQEVRPFWNYKRAQLDQLLQFATAVDVHIEYGFNVKRSAHIPLILLGQKCRLELNQRGLCRTTNQKETA